MCVCEGACVDVWGCVWMCVCEGSKDVCKGVYGCLCKGVYACVVVCVRVCV